MHTSTKLKQTILRVILCCCLAFICTPAKCQTVGGYQFETGIDSSLWYKLTDYDSLSYSEAWEMPLNPAGLYLLPYDIKRVSLGFDFFFCNRYYNSAFPFRNGYLMLDSLSYLIHEFRFDGWHYGYSFTFDSLRPPMLAPFSQTLHFDYDTSCHIRWQTFGDPGEKVFVCELQLLADYAYIHSLRKLQIILNEADASITYLYGPKLDTIETRSQIGFLGEDNIKVFVDSKTNTASTRPAINIQLGDWPDANRYYRFTPANQPLCGAPGIFKASYVGSTRANVTWSSSHYDSIYTFEYRPAGIGAYWTTIDTYDTIVHLTNLTPSTDYECRIYNHCCNGLTSAMPTTTFHTKCIQEDYNLITYDKLRTDSVQCTYGWRYYIDGHITTHTYSPGIFDEYYIDPEDTTIVHPPRHLVIDSVGFYDERTIHTAGSPGLLKVPPQHCTSVRLGNWQTGGGMETITYAIQVDTNIFDLLILRYALVAEDPNHADEDQPQFSIDITDSEGNTINSCYYTNFISGAANAGWNISGTTSWRDWSVMGIDLTALHGQLIRVILHNHDCARGGHFGYAYYTLEGSFKRLRASSCGDSETNVFYAPKGFSYFWYREDNPTQIIGTADSLIVTTPGTYCCYATYKNGCGFTLKMTHGPRYPKADFRIEPINDCNQTYHFVNNSAVATNTALTNLINEPCEDYLWRFDDGTISREINPTKSFLYGTHTVELVATLAGGQCRDSMSLTFTNLHPYDTIADTMCYGKNYEFHGKQYSEPGDYTVTEGCHKHTLNLRTYQVFQKEIIDTLCEGQAFIIGDSAYSASGHYHHHEYTAEGCDSSFLIDLTIRPMPARVPELFQSCEKEDPYYYFKDTYTPADSQHNRPNTLTLWDADSLLYRWQTYPADAPKPYLDSTGQLHFSPNRFTVYRYSHFYPDAPACTVTDSLRLTPVPFIQANIDFHPGYIEPDKLDFCAHDVSNNATHRQWFINEEPQNELTEFLCHTAEPFADSVLVGLIAANNSCADTTQRAIYVKRINILFPNAFTPTLPTNNTFGPVYHDIADYEIWIYDRRGDLVFHTTDINQHWDGTHNGTPCRQETYVYSCFYTTKLNDKLKASGTVTLLR